ncbi:hypothetical protein V8F33_006243 [Rhypophila sp. PSN 637]
MRPTTTNTPAPLPVVSTHHIIDTPINPTANTTVTHTHTVAAAFPSAGIILTSHVQPTTTTLDPTILDPQSASVQWINSPTPEQERQTLAIKKRPSLSQLTTRFLSKFDGPADDDDGSGDTPANHQLDESPFQVSEGQSQETETKVYAEVEAAAEAQTQGVAHGYGTGSVEANGTATEICGSLAGCFVSGFVSGLGEEGFCGDGFGVDCGGLV